MPHEICGMFIVPGSPGAEFGVPLKLIIFSPDIARMGFGVPIMLLCPP